MLVYAGVLHAPFVFDDYGSVLSNPSLAHLWPPWALRPPPGSATVSGRPLLNLSFALDWAIGGPRPGPFHVTNVAIHCAAALVLFDLAAQACAQLIPAQRRGFALCLAAVWALHPLQTESVSYVAQRAESLAGLCYLLTLDGFARGCRPGGRRWLLLALAACWLGVGVKETLVTAPVMVLLYGRAFVYLRWRDLWRLHAWFFVLLFGSWVPLAALMWANGLDRGGSFVVEGAASWGGYVAAQAQAIADYLHLSVWPDRLALVHGPVPIVPGVVRVAVAAAVLAGAGAALRGAVRGNAAGFCGAAFFLVLAPTSLIPGTMQPVAEHRMYLPLAALAALLLGLLFRWDRARGVANCRTACTLAAAWAAAGAVGTWVHNREYRSAANLWAWNAARYPQSAQAHACYATALAAAGRGPEAVQESDRALALSPADVREVDLGLAYESSGNPEEALRHYWGALQLNDRMAFAHFCAGRVLLGQGRISGAETELARAAAQLPRKSADWAQAEVLLGACHGRSGQTAVAAGDFARALAIDPYNAEAHYDLGMAWQAMGRPEQAREEFARAAALTLLRGQATERGAFAP